MFDISDILSTMWASIGFAVWLESFAADIEAQAWHDLLTTTPLWFRLPVIAALLIKFLESAKALSRRLLA